MADPEAQKVMLRRMFDDGKSETSRVLTELERATDIYFDRVSQIKMPIWSRGRIALVGDAAFCVSLMAGQGAALAMTAAYVLAGETGKSGQQYQKGFWQLCTNFEDFHRIKARGCRPFCIGLCAKDAMGPLSAESNNQGECGSWSGPAFIRKRYY